MDTVETLRTWSTFEVIDNTGAFNFPPSALTSCHPLPALVKHSTETSGQIYIALVTGNLLYYWLPVCNNDRKILKDRLSTFICLTLDLLRTHSEARTWTFCMSTSFFRPCWTRTSLRSNTDILKTWNFRSINKRHARWQICNKGPMNRLICNYRGFSFSILIEPGSQSIAFSAFNCFSTQHSCVIWLMPTHS